MQFSDNQKTVENYLYSLNLRLENWGISALVEMVNQFSSVLHHRLYTTCLSRGGKSWFKLVCFHGSNAVSHIIYHSTVVNLNLAMIKYDTYIQHL